MGRRFGHGELHLVLLALLAGRPMHGYELMAELGDRVGRGYRPSPGSIYPAVAALTTEGLITADADGGRRTYRLTRQGAAALGKRSAQLERIERSFGTSFRTDPVELALVRFADRVRTAARAADPASVAAFVDGIDVRVSRGEEER